MSGLRRLARASRGVAITEFAIGLPILIMLVTSTYEVAQYTRVRMKVSHAASDLAKMIAQQSGPVTAGTSGTLGDLCTGASYDMLPFARTSVAAAIASVTRSTTGSTTTTTRDWESDASCPVAATAIGASAAVTAGTPYMTSTTADSVIVARVSYTYAPAFRMILGSSIAMSATGYARPRTGTTIACTNC